MSAKSNFVCVNSRSWSPPTLFPKDCISAALQFNYQELLMHEERAVEFVPLGAINRSMLPVEFTPRKYTYQSCTMAIANLGAFQPGEIPKLSPSREFPRTDVGNFRDIWTAVRRIIDNCLDSFCSSDCEAPLTFVTQTGWSYAGDAGSIGVFLWGTDSAINHEVFSRRGFPSGPDGVVVIDETGSSQVAPVQ